MRRHMVAVVMMLIPGLVACQPAADEAMPAAEEMVAVDVAAEAEQIRTLSMEWSARASDPDAFVSYFAPNAMLMPDNSPPLDTHEAIRGFIAEMSGQPGFTVSWQSDRVEVAESGDLAYETGTYQLAFDAPDGRVEDQGKYVTVWSKVGDEWKVMADIFNSNLPAPGQ